MSTPKYKSNNYDSAVDKFNELADKYSGENGFNIASQQARKDAVASSQEAGTSATNQALNQNYSRAKAAMKGATASANQFNQSYNQGFQNVSDMNKNRVNAQAQVLSGAMQKDQNKYQSKANNFSAGLGLVGGALGAGALMFSDENTKDIGATTGGESIDVPETEEDEEKNKKLAAVKMISDSFNNAADVYSKGLPPKNGLTSDEELKSINDDFSERLVEGFAKLSALDFTYKKEIQEEKDGVNGIDDKEHIGISAQELEANPITNGAVSEDEDGHKIVDSRHLTAANTAVLGELSRRVLELEEEIKKMRGE